MSKMFNDDEEVLENVTDDVEEFEDDELDLDDPVKMGEWVLSILLAFIPIVNIDPILFYLFELHNHCHQYFLHLQPY